MATKKKIEEVIGVGRRKTAIASVRLRPGTGRVDINGREDQDYFPIDLQRTTAYAPFSKAGTKEDYDLIVRIKGGGPQAQVIAMQLGIARALVEQNEANRAELKSAGYLTRDARKKERKKYGLAGARKRFQFSKR